MDAQVRWDNDAQTVIRYAFSGDWNWDDFYKFLEQNSMYHAANAYLCTLIDMRGVAHFPSDAILRLKRAAQMMDEVSGLIIVIGDGFTLPTLFRLYVMIYKPPSNRFRLVSNDAEAYALLQTPS